MKKVVFTVFMMLLIAVECNAVTDINGTKYEKAVTHLIENNIISGYPDNTFKPNKTITRAEITTVITKFNKIDVNENTYLKFTDISNHWGKFYINTLAELGFVSGYENNDFRPDNEVTCAEVTAMLLNSLGYKDEIASMELEWPNNYINKADTMGLYENLDLIEPNKKMTRGDVAILVYNAEKSDGKIDINRIISDEYYDYIFLDDKMYYVAKYQDFLQNCSLDGTKSSEIEVSESIKNIEFAYNNSIYCTTTYGEFLKINLINGQVTKVFDEEIIPLPTSLSNGEIIYYTENYIKYPYTLTFKKLNLDTLESETLISNTCDSEDRSYYNYKGNLYYWINSGDKYEVYGGDKLLYTTADEIVNSLMVNKGFITMVFDECVRLYNLKSGKIEKEANIDISDYCLIPTGNCETKLMYKNSKLYQWDPKTLSLDEIKYNKFNSDILLDNSLNMAYVLKNKIVFIGRDILVYDLNTGHADVYKDVSAYEIQDNKILYMFYENSIKNKIEKISLEEALKSSNINKGGVHKHWLAVHQWDNGDGTHNVGTICFTCGEKSVDYIEEHNLNRDGKCRECGVIIPSHKVDIIFECDENQQVFEEDDCSFKFSISGEGRKEVTYKFLDFENLGELDAEMLERKEIINDFSKNYEVNLPSEIRHSIPSEITFYVGVNNEAGEMFEEERRVTLDRKFYCWTEYESQTNQIVAYSDGMEVAKCMIIKGDSNSVNSEVLLSETRQVENTKMLQTFSVDVSNINSQVTVLMYVKKQAKTNTGKILNIGKIIKNVYNVKDNKVEFKSNESDNISIGDANADGKFDIKDLSIFYWSNPKTPELIFKGDVNLDGIFDNQDIEELMEKYEVDTKGEIPQIVLPTKEVQDIAIEILNSTYNSKLLTSASEKLKAEGYNIIRTGIRAPRVPTTIINKKEANYAQQIKEILGVGRVKTEIDENSKVDVEIILGNDYK